MDNTVKLPVTNLIARPITTVSASGTGGQGITLNASAFGTSISNIVSGTGYLNYCESSTSPRGGDGHERILFWKEIGMFKICCEKKAYGDGFVIDITSLKNPCSYATPIFQDGERVVECSEEIMDRLTKWLQLLKDTERDVDELIKYFGRTMLGQSDLAEKADEIEGKKTKNDS